MPVADNMKNVGGIVKAAAGLLALFPGIAILLGLVDIPPSVGNLIKVISFSVSVLVILAVFLLSDRIQRMSNNRAVLYAIIAVVIGSATATTYYQFANSRLVTVQKVDGSSEKYLAPGTPSQQILDIVQPAVDGRPTISEYQFALQSTGAGSDLKDLMLAESRWTMILMVVLLILSEVLLVAPIIAAAWKLAGAAIAPEADAQAAAAAPARRRKPRAPPPPSG